MASNRESLILNTQDKDKNTVKPDVFNEMTQDQLDMVSGSFGVIANNSNISIFGSTFTNGTAPIIVENNSTIEVEQSKATGKNANADNSKFVVALDNNNIQIDTNTETNSNERITRKSAVDISNSTNFPSPGPGYLESYKTTNVIYIDNTETIIAAGPVVNDGIDASMAHPSAGVLLDNFTLNFVKNNITDFYNKPLSANLNSFIKNLPKDLNGKMLIFVLGNFNQDLDFSNFYGGTIELQTPSSVSYSGSINFSDCRCSITFEKFNKTSKSMTFTRCDNVIVSNSNIKSQINVYFSKCHFRNCNFKDCPTPIIRDNEQSHVLFDQCDNCSGTLVTTSKGSQISRTDRFATTDELLKSNFIAEQGENNTTNHFHIANEHINNDYPIGTVYGFPRIYTRRDIIDNLSGYNSNTPVSIIPSRHGFTARYLPDGDLPLDMNGTFINTYAENVNNYETVHGITPSCINTYEPNNSITIFDWHKLKSEMNNLESNDSNIIENYAITSITSAITAASSINDLTANESSSGFFITTPITGCTSAGICLTLNSVDVGNVNAGKTAWANLNVVYDTTGIRATITRNGNFTTDSTANYTVDISGLSAFIPSNIVKESYAEFDVTSGSQIVHKKVMYGEPVSFRDNFELSNVFILNNFKLYVPFISIFGKYNFALISTQNPFRELQANEYVNMYENRYGENKSGRYNYNMPGLPLNISGYIALQSNPRNNLMLNHNNWTIFSDTIFVLKTGTSYESTKIYNGINTDFTDIINQQSSYNYLRGNESNINNFIFNVADNEPNTFSKVTSNYINTKTTPNIIYQTTSMVSDYYRIEADNNGELTYVKDKDNNFPASSAVEKTFLTLNMQQYYTIKNIIYYDNTNSAYINIQPLKTRTSNLELITDDNVLSSIYADYNTKNNSDICKFEFHRDLIHMVARHKLFTMPGSMLTTINGININTSATVKLPNGNETVSFKYPNDDTNKAFKHFNGLALSAMMGSVGAFYPIFKKNTNFVFDEIQGFHNPEQESKIKIKCPINKPKEFLPKYFGIPYIKTDYTDMYITYTDYDNTINGTIYSSQLASSYLGTASTTELFENINLSNATLMPFGNSFSVKTGVKGAFYSNTPLLQIFNLNVAQKEFYNIGKKLLIEVHYDRAFEERYISPGKINIYNDISSTAPSLSFVFNNDTDFIDKCKEAANRIFDNCIIEFKFDGNTENKIPGFSHFYTNINKDEVEDILINLNGKPYFKGLYHTSFKIESIWEWELFYLYYTSKINFIISKLNRFYRQFMKYHKDTVRIEDCISVINLLQEGDVPAWIGTNPSKTTSTDKIHLAKQNISNGIIHDFFDVVGQFRYPLGNFEEVSYKVSILPSGFINYTIYETSNGGNNTLSAEELYTDRNKWAFNSYSMESILNSDSYNTY